MERRPAYAALRGDYYTHCLDLPPQLSPFGLARSRGATAAARAPALRRADRALGLVRGQRAEREWRFLFCFIFFKLFTSF